MGGPYPTEDDDFANEQGRTRFSQVGDLRFGRRFCKMLFEGIAGKDRGRLLFDLDLLDDVVHMRGGNPHQPWAR